MIVAVIVAKNFFYMGEFNIVSHLEFLPALVVLIQIE